CLNRTGLWHRQVEGPSHERVTACPGCSRIRPMSLPIDLVLPDLLQALRERPAVVLQAPPGAGKTTRVPLALLAEPWLADRRIIMLEPRRLAARAAARFMASLLGEEVGQRV